MALVSVLIRTVDDQTTPQPIAGVLVQIFDFAGVYVTEGMTDGLGEVTFSLNGDTPGVDYTARIIKYGVSFPPSSSLSLLVTDPPSPPNEFEAVGHVGMTGTVVTLNTIDDQEPPGVIEGFRLNVFDGSDSFLTEVYTDSNGKAELVLDGAPAGTPYIVRALKPGWTLPDGATQVILVLDPIPIGGTNSFDLIAHQAVIPESTIPWMCVISGYLTTVSGVPIPRAKIRIVPLPYAPDVLLGGMVAQSQPAEVYRSIPIAETIVETSSTGYVEFTLPRKGVYSFDILGAVHRSSSYPATLYVPDRAGAKLEDVLYVYTRSVDYDSTSVSVPVGETLALGLSSTCSNDRVITEKALLDAALQFTVADPTIATFQLTSDGVGTITGLSSGSTSLTVARKDDTYAYRVPEIADLVASTVTIQVP